MMGQVLRDGTCVLHFVGKTLTACRNSRSPHLDSGGFFGFEKLSEVLLPGLDRSSSKTIYLVRPFALIADEIASPAG